MRKYLIPRSFAAFTKSVAMTLPLFQKKLPLFARNPIRAGERHASHCRRLDRKGDEVLGLEIVHMALAASPSDGLRLEREHGEIVGKTPAAQHRIEARGKYRILRGDAGGITALMPVVIAACCAAELAVFRIKGRMVVAERDQRGSADRHGVGAERKRLGDVRTVP